MLKKISGGHRWTGRSAPAATRCLSAGGSRSRLGIRTSPPRISACMSAILRRSGPRSASFRSRRRRGRNAPAGLRASCLPASRPTTGREPSTTAFITRAGAARRARSSSRATVRWKSATAPKAGGSGRCMGRSTPAIINWAAACWWATSTRSTGPANGRHRSRSSKAVRGIRRSSG